MSAAQEWILQPRKIEMGKVREWAAANLRAGDAVVIETTTNVWAIAIPMNVLAYFPRFRVATSNMTATTRTAARTMYW